MSEKEPVAPAALRGSLIERIRHHVEELGDKEIPILSLAEETSSNTADVMHSLLDLILEGKIRARLEDQGTADSDDDVLHVDQNWDEEASGMTKVKALKDEIEISIAGGDWIGVLALIDKLLTCMALSDTEHVRWSEYRKEVAEKLD